MQIPPVDPNRPPYDKRIGQRDPEKVSEIDKSHPGRRDKVEPVLPDRRRKDRRRQQQPVKHERRKGDRRRAQRPAPKKIRKLLRYTNRPWAPDGQHEPGEIIDKKV